MPPRDAESACVVTGVQRAEATFERCRSMRHRPTSTVGSIRLSLQRDARRKEGRALDLFIAASALSRELALYRCNPGDFRELADLLEVVAFPASQPCRLDSAGSYRSTSSGQNQGMGRTITQRELRNESGEIMRALDRGESFVVTRNGVPVGELTPIRRRRFVPPEEAIAAFQGAPPIDYTRFRRDLDQLVDQDPAPRA
jgi:prevent-host-death family protein